jgi:O-antigen ligase/Tfp pilus assembly protein PilF
MNERGWSQRGEDAGGCSGVIAGAFILLASLAFVPASFNALNFFDPVKRLVWSLLAVALAVLVWRRRHSARLVTGLAVSLSGWMVLRSLLRPVPTAELGVLASWCLPILFFYLGAGLPLKRKDRRIVGGFLVAATLIQAVLMILQRMGIDPLFAATTAGMDYAPGRMVGTIGYQNQAADFLALAMPGILLLTASPAWFLCGAALMLPVILLTGYRGGIVAFAFGVLLSGALLMLAHSRLRGNRFRLATVAGMLALCMGIMVIAIALIPPTKERFREAFTDFNAAPAIQSRFTMARIGWQMFRERPLIGWGAGAYAMQYLDRLGTVLPSEKDHTILRSVVFAREAHNDPLQFVAEFGLIGLALLAAVFVAVWRCVLRQSSFLQWQGIALAYVSAYMAAAALFSFPWQSAMAGPLAGLLLGICLPTRVIGPDASKGARLALHGCDALVLLMAIALLGWFGRDAYLNLAIPARLATDDTEGAAKRLSPEAYRYHALVGASLATQGHNDAALTTLRHARLGYRDVLLWNNLGHVLSRSGQWQEAKGIYEVWAASGLDHANALQNLSVASEQVGDFPFAVESMSRRMTLWPNEISAHDIKRLAVLQIRVGAARDAAETLRRYRSTWQDANPKAVAEIENLAGGVAQILGDKKQAIQYYRAALELDPALESARLNLQSIGNQNLHNLPATADGTPPAAAP